MGNNQQAIGLTGMLTIVFIGLKLAKIINWSWVWVLSPLWISALLGFGIFTLSMIIVLISILIKK